MCSYEIIPIKYSSCRFKSSQEYNFIGELTGQAVSQLMKIREQQIKDAILARGYVVDDWIEFAKSRCTIVVGSDRSLKSLFVDHVLICRWSDDVIAEYDFSRTDFTTTLSIKVG